MFVQCIFSRRCICFAQIWYDCREPYGKGLNIRKCPKSFGNPDGSYVADCSKTIRPNVMTCLIILATSNMRRNVTLYIALKLNCYSDDAQSSLQYLTLQLWLFVFCLNSVASSPRGRLSGTRTVKYPLPVAGCLKEACSHKRGGSFEL